MAFCLPLVTDIYRLCKVPAIEQLPFILLFYHSSPDITVRVIVLDMI